MNAASMAELRVSARRTLAREVWDFLAGGSGDEVTLSANSAAFRQLVLTPRTLTDVSDPETACHLFGSAASMPVAIAPMAYQRLFHDMGEVATAAAAAANGVPFVISMLSSALFEDIVGTGATTWLQLYWLRDRSQLLDVVQRAEELGCRALMLTTDVPVMASRRRDMRNGFALPDTIRAVNLREHRHGPAHQRVASVSAIATHSSQLFDPSLTWSDIEWLRSVTGLPMILKGILHPADAKAAADLGVAGVVVSNHGGRQLDQAIPAISALPAVAAAVDGRCEVLMDSGVRSGRDVLLALARGASAVLVGRPIMWGLAARGDAGCRDVLTLLRDELRQAMQLAGCPTLGAIKSLPVSSAW